MATDIFPKKMLEKQTLTPEMIISKLSFFKEQVDECHYNTKSHAQHEAGNYYSELVDFKDRIAELLLGYMAPRRFGPIPTYKTSPTAQMADVIKDIISFSHDLYNYAESNTYRGLANVADDLEASAVKVNYLLTLS